MTNQYLWDRIVGRDPNLRAADADRERIAERLRQSHAEGRLDMAEFQERLECCYESKTFGQLDALVKDLPRQSELDERRSVASVRPWQWLLAPLAPILIALIVVSAAVGHHVVLLWILFLFVFWRMSRWRRRRWMAGGRRFPDQSL
jgi:hypothetical protein